MTVTGSPALGGPPARAGGAGTPARGRPRRWLRRLAWLLVLAGLGLVGYAAWELYGTDWTSERTQERVRGALREEWRRGGASVRVDDGGRPDADGAMVADALIRIPRFGDDYVIPVLEGTSSDALAAGFGHVEGTAGPGEVGNYALAAHRTTRNEPLRHLPDLRPGDRVVLETRDRLYTYVLDTRGDALEVDFTDDWVLAPLPTNPEPGGVQPAQEPGQRLLTLTTCAELFSTDGRLVAFGHLDSTTPR